MTKYISLIFFLLALSSRGQVNFQKGFIIRVSGDTLRGEIDNKDWVKSPDIIRFRKNKEAEIQRFSPYQCQSFGLETGLSYRSIRTTLNRTKEYYDKPNFEIVADTTVFMEVIAKGELILYEFIEKGEKSRFFIQKGAIKTEQLIYHSMYQDTKLLHNRRYQSQLTDLTGNQNTVNIPYERNTLIKFVNQNNHTNISTAEKANSKKSLIIQVGIGATYYQPLSITRIDNNLEIANFSSTTKPAFGLNVSFPFSKNFNSLAFDFSTLFNPYTTNKESGGSYLSVKKIHTNNLYISLGARYMFFTKQQLRPFLGFGAGINEPFGDYLVRNDGTKAKLPIRPQNGEFEFNVHPARLYAKIGLQINKKIETELRFDRIPKYNLRIDAKAPLKMYSFIFYWTIN